MLLGYAAETRQKALDHIACAIPILEMLPCVTIIHDAFDGSVIHISQKGTEQLGSSLKELQEMGTDYHTRFFNPEQSAEYVPQLLKFVSKNNREACFTYFQQVRIQGYEDWQWYLSCSRVFFQEDTGAGQKPMLILTMAQHISPDNHFTRKIDRLLEELNFVRSQSRAFGRLGRREKEILKLMAAGITSNEIAETLFLSPHTVNTHRKNIRQKLAIDSSKKLDLYARAFELM